MSPTHCCRRWSALFAHFSFISNALSQLNAADFYGQLPVPAFRARPANTLWPFPLSSAYSDPNNQQNTGAYATVQQPPLYQLPYPVWSPPQRPQPVQLNDLIAQLSLAIVRSFAQMLADREMGTEGIRTAPQDPITRNEPSTGRDLDPSPPGGGGGNALTAATAAEAVQSIPGSSVNRRPLPAAHSLRLAPPFPSAGGNRPNTKYDFGVKAGVFVGHYGTSESIVSPFGPYGPLNSQIGGSYGGLSQWPIVSGRPSPSTTPKNANAVVVSQPPLSFTTTTSRHEQSAIANITVPPPSPPVMGEGTVVQIPLGENVQSGSDAQQMPAFNNSEGTELAAGDER
uniref:Uncharacterized protein n=1 Tax=Globodera rostochiensis TaxID=31243 RepID=A0A914I4L2_GLORO